VKVLPIEEVEKELMQMLELIEDVDYKLVESRPAA
jgi:hypothetical protein